MPSADSWRTAQVMVLPRRAMPPLMTTSARSWRALKKSGASWMKSRKLSASISARLRKAKDQDEFDRFMAERNAPPPSEPPAT